MEPKRILIVDDEMIARNRIHRFLSESAEIRDFTDVTFQIEQAQNGLEAVEKAESFRPHIVFLDVQMPGLDGFEALSQIEKRDFQVVFQTAYDEFALKAFEESAIDYLLKPFTKERFAKALQKALHFADQAESLARLKAGLHKSQRFLERIVFKQGAKVRVLNAADVVCFVSREHCTSAHTSSGESIIDFSLNYLEENLDPERFIRCHRSNIVAVDHIRALTGREDSESSSDLELSNGMRLPLSRKNRPKVADRLRGR